MLCFEVWRNDEKLVTAGLSETGVLSFILTWVGKEPDAPRLRLHPLERPQDSAATSVV
jgi:hypothetical protein